MAPEEPRDLIERATETTLEVAALEVAAPFMSLVEYRELVRREVARLVLQDARQR